MGFQSQSLLLLSLIFFSCKSVHVPEAEGSKFNLDKDLLLLHYDFKTDVDDLHSVAAFATFHTISKYSNIKYHAVAGTYGTQTGLYVPPNDLCKKAFGTNWSDAHLNFDHSVDEVKKLAIRILNGKGNIWIADGGQSDFSAALVEAIQASHTAINTQERIHIVQHSDWNEEVTSQDRLSFVKRYTDYQKIPDGNTRDNGTPDFRDDRKIDLNTYLSDPHLLSVWQTAIDIANKYNGHAGRYLNESIAAGGLDFSDFSEVCWIFGLNELKDAHDFFGTFFTGEEQW